MSSKIATIALFVVATAASIEAGHGFSYAAASLVGGYGGYSSGFKGHTSYYGVHDAHAGDIKDQREERDGDVVKGSYSLVEPDGTKRVVDYTADGHNGFNAVVKRTGHASHPAYYGHGAY